MKCFFQTVVCGILSVLSLTTSAQFYFYNNRYYDQDFLFESGFSAGLMNALTDLGGSSAASDLNLCNNQFCAGAYGLVHYRGMISLQLQFTHGNIKAFDSVLRNRNDPPTGRYERNLSFETAINELSLCFQFYPFNIFWQTEKPPIFSPYCSLGIGLFHFNPSTVLNGKSYNLHTCHTEGQGFPEFPERKNYNLTTTNWILGAGVRFEISPRYSLRLDFLYRILHTDYLDDVSTNYIEPKLFRKYLNPEVAAVAYFLADRRGELDPTHEPAAGDKRGNPDRNDSYFSLELKFGIVLGRERIR